MAILDLIFPKTCLGCGKSETYICRNCLKKVQILVSSCPYCERPSLYGFTHKGCRRPQGLDGLVSVWKYQGIIKKAVLSLKYKYSTEVGKELTEIYIEELSKRPKIIKEETLVPVPIHRHRENVRGFNQAELVGKVVAKKMGWNYIPDLLIKKSPTKSQVELSIRERRRNLKGVFVFNLKHQVPASIILFDDVFTTGSTLKESAKVLKSAGVKKVWGLTLAR